MVRLLRVTAIATLLPLLFQWSQRTAAAHGDEPVPGLFAALGVVSLIFLARAITAERAADPQPVLQRDVFWGLALGGVATIVMRLMA